ncbi:MAG: hypothetical protein ACRDRK_27520 [Pseudonocardia sp.]
MNTLNLWIHRDTGHNTCIGGQRKTAPVTISGRREARAVPSRRPAPRFWFTRARRDKST